MGVAVVLVACVGDDPPPTKGGVDGGTVGTVDSAPPTVTRSINCNSNAVCTGNDVCCSLNNTWAKGTGTCKPTCGAERTFACDDASDCATGLVCCMTTDGGAQAIAASCAASCSGSQEQLCSLTASECTGGKSCMARAMFSPDVSTCR